MRRTALRAVAAACASSSAFAAQTLRSPPVKCQEAPADSEPTSTLRTVERIGGRHKRQIAGPEGTIWVEPRSGVPFPERTSALAALPGGKSTEVDIPFLGGGVRCMPPWEPCSQDGKFGSTGSETDTHVYAYAIYADVPEKCGEFSFEEALLHMDKHPAPRNIRVVVTIPKGGLHWSKGYYIALFKRLRAAHWKSDKKRFKKAKRGILKFANCFVELGVVGAGATFDLVWTTNGLLVSLDGKEIGRVKNADCIAMIYDMYFGQDFNAVNQPVALNVALQWRSRCQRPGAQFKQPPIMVDPFDPRNQPDYDQCVLRSNQWSSSDGHSFDRALQVMREKKEEKRKKRMGKNYRPTGERPKYSQPEDTSKICPARQS